MVYLKKQQQHDSVMKIYQTSQKQQHGVTVVHAQKHDPTMVKVQNTVIPWYIVRKINYYNGKCPNKHGIIKSTCPQNMVIP